MTNPRNNGTSILERITNKVRSIFENEIVEYCDYFDNKEGKCILNPEKYCINPSGYKNCETYNSINVA